MMKIRSDKVKEETLQKNLIVLNLKVLIIQRNPTITYS